MNITKVKDVYYIVSRVMRDFESHATEIDKRISQEGPSRELQNAKTEAQNVATKLALIRSLTLEIGKNPETKRIGKDLCYSCPTYKKIFAKKLPAFIKSCNKLLKAVPDPISTTDKQYAKFKALLEIALVKANEMLG